MKCTNTLWFHKFNNIIYRHNCISSETIWVCKSKHSDILPVSRLMQGCYHCVEHGTQNSNNRKLQKNNQICFCKSSLHQNEHKFTAFTGKFTEAINVYNSDDEYLNLVSGLPNSTKHHLTTSLRWKLVNSSHGKIYSWPSSLKWNAEPTHSR